MPNFKQLQYKPVISVCWQLGGTLLGCRMAALLSASSLYTGQYLISTTLRTHHSTRPDQINASTFTHTHPAQILLKLTSANFWSYLMNF